MISALRLRQRRLVLPNYYCLEWDRCNLPVLTLRLCVELIDVARNRDDTGYERTTGLGWVGEFGGGVVGGIVLVYNCRYWPRHCDCGRALHTFNSLPQCLIFELSMLNGITYPLVSFYVPFVRQTRAIRNSAVFPLRLPVARIVSVT